MKKPVGRLLALLALLLAALLASGLTGFSGATYVAATQATATVTAAADWTPPTVSLNTPTNPLQRTVTLTATATDSGLGVDTVTIQQQAPGASGWTAICADSTAPYSCAWDTTTGADGSYDLRAKAVDKAGLATLSDSITVVVANSVVITLADPGDIVHGAVPLTTNLYNAGSLPWLVTVQYATAGGSTWRNICTGLASPFPCTWATAPVADGSYDLRATATSGTTTVTSAVVTDVLVDNTGPVVTMTDPGTPVSGTTTFSATASDAASDVARVELQYALGTGAWRTLCTISTSPWSCRYDTTTLSDGSYSFRAIATDLGGNATTSTAVTGRVIDNTVASVSLTDPGAYLTGSVTLAAQANSSAGVASVRIQRAVSGTTTWTDVCTDTSAPYSCVWDTTAVSDGLYDLRAILTDTRGATTTSATVSARRVDNSPLRGVDVQTQNGDGTPGRVDTNDVMTLVYSGVVAPSSISAGWNGTAQAVTLRLRDGALLGTGTKGDTADILKGGTAVNLGSVALKEDYVKKSKSVSLNATMTAATVTGADGVPHTVVTIQVGTSPGTNLRTVTLPSSMVWTPSALATAATGEKCSAAPVTESGAADREW
ncbi:Ig-like domain-containing protein [Nocardioides montaniterrae]